MEPARSGLLWLLGAGAGQAGTLSRGEGGRWLKGAQGLRSQGQSWRCRLWVAVGTSSDGTSLPSAGQIQGPGCVPVYNQVAPGNPGPEARPQTSPVTLPGA